MKITRKVLPFVLIVPIVASAAPVEWTFPRLGNCHEGVPYSDGVTGVLVWGGGDTVNLTVGRGETGAECRTPRASFGAVKEESVSHGKAFWVRSAKVKVPDPVLHASSTTGCTGSAR